MVSGRQLLALAGDEAAPLETAAGDAPEAPGGPLSGGASAYGEDLGGSASAGLIGPETAGALTPDETGQGLSFQGLSFQGLSFDVLDGFANHGSGLLLPDDAAAALATLDPPTGPLADPGTPGAPGGGGQNNGGGGGQNNAGGGGQGQGNAGGGQGQEGGITLTGTGGADTLQGGAGDDTLDGKNGDDLLIGGAGDDQLEGGKGADIFLFDFAGGTANEGDDTVLDFDPAKGDALRFSNVLDADSDGADVDDVVAAIASVQDDGSDVTVFFAGGGSITLAGLGTGGIDAVAALLTVFGPDGIEVV